MKEIEDLRKRIQKEQDRLSGIVIISVVLIATFLSLRVFMDVGKGEGLTPYAAGFVLMGFAIQNKRLLKNQSDLIKLVAEKN